MNYPNRPIKINGVPAEMDGRTFSATMRLVEKINRISASVATPYGEVSQEIVLVWDRQSFRRFNFYIDDNVFLFAELAKERPERTFSHFYLADFKKIHEKYGLKLTLLPGKKHGFRPSLSTGAISSGGRPGAHRPGD